MNTTSRPWLAKGAQVWLLAAALPGWTGCARPPAEPARAEGALTRIAARTFDSPVSFSSHTCNAIGTASDGRIYYVLSSNLLDTGGQMYAYDPGRTR
jgi:hypothetical protein